MPGDVTVATIGRCIYCGATRYNAQREKLAGEHVVALGLHGHRVLGEASCERCERKVNSYEQPCMKQVFGPVRYYLGVRTRNPKERPERLPLLLRYAGGRPERTIEIPIADYPPMVCTIHFDPPTFLSLPGHKGDRSVIVTYPAGIGATRRWLDRIAYAWGAENVNPSALIGSDQLRRTLAKIGHAYTVSVVGYGNFEPLLLKYVSGENPEDGPKYVGTDFRKPDAPKGLHEVRLEPMYLEGRLLLVATIRLFANIGCPQYIAVVGWLSRGIELPTNHYIEPGPELPPGRIHADVRT